ncbi:MAG: SRPBCC domain-containing protein [Williamsia sp.]|nr:SRPBCC domain-containing protein [Williamsia sp.]
MENRIVTKRIYQAPVTLVWKAWTDPELVKKWWGPDKFSCHHATIDFREGGVSVVSMKAPAEFGGKEWFNHWEYRKIVPLERIEFDQSFCDKEGKKIRPAEAGMPPDFPAIVFTVVTFKDLGNGKTETTVIQHADMGQMTRNAKMGMEQSLGKMDRLFNN